MTSHECLRKYKSASSAISSLGGGELKSIAAINSIQCHVVIHAFTFHMSTREQRHAKTGLKGVLRLRSPSGHQYCGKRIFNNDKFKMG